MLMALKVGENMALSSISIEIVNNPYKGCIEIKTEQATSELGEIEYLIISRKSDNDSEDIDRILEKKIESLDDLNYIYRDLSSICGVTYTYFVELTDGIEVGYSILESDTFSGIECVFDGIFVGDENKQYMAILNCSTSIVRNTQQNYVTTLLGRTPYKVSNANVNYTTGQSSGLFVRFDEYNKPIAEMSNSYRIEVIDFLTDGNDKILKTSNGDVWLVSIDSNVDLNFDDNYSGYNLISFSWTEIGDVPLLRTVS